MAQTSMTQGMGAPQSPDLARRIDKMFATDRFWAFGFVVVLWLTVAFVLHQVNPYLRDDSIRHVLWVAAAILLLFNTAAIVAMVRHYSHDKAHIYGLDIRHLDIGR